MTSLPYFDADAVRAALPYDRAMRAIREGLLNGVDPELDGPRLFSPAPGGEFLLMPAQGAEYSGLKALTVAPGNPARGLEKIQGLYVLYSSDTLAPVAVMEGASLTAIRTPAVALTAVRALAEAAPSGAELPAEPRVLVFGAGVQAASHIEAALAGFPGARFDVVGRRPERVTALRETVAPIEFRDRTSDPEDAVREADVILCVTSASAPLFDGSLVRDHAIVAAVGTHGRELRELDDALVSRADIVVEGRDSARRENGNLATAIDDAGWESAPPANLHDLVSGRVVRTPGRPAVYTGVGMSWEDLICASVVFAEGRLAREN
ncbi:MULTISPECIES: ornithine cyclodeaminase family protein [unclassified Leucobacter]|uniref:ornithine cyclodeaminase family protein n=1 Tax=unclassified Leucobacter TaxID=2621730 RepID=UPI0006228E85|nr:ornithine cyclodeaminase family protein [Leucobacter sp. Ag1]KKI22374.1 crystallin [Leucobacter sp. Ag1]